MVDINNLRGIPATEEFIQKLSHAIGFLAVQFGTFEFSLNGSIAVIHQWVAQPVETRGELPYLALTDRLRYVRTAARHYSALEPYKEEFLELAALAKRLSSTRNNTVHGYSADYDPDTHALTFVGAVPADDKTIHRFTTFIITLSDLNDHGDRAQELSNRMSLILVFFAILKFLPIMDRPSLQRLSWPQ